jgi:hypothetical protein
MEFLFILVTAFGLCGALCSLGYLLAKGIK